MTLQEKCKAGSGEATTAGHAKVSLGNDALLGSINEKKRNPGDGQGVGGRIRS